MILVVVRKVGWNQSPWDSFTRAFKDEHEFMDWWVTQSADSYMKKVAVPHERVKVYRVDSEGRDLLLADADLYGFLDQFK